MSAATVSCVFYTFEITARKKKQVGVFGNKCNFNEKRHLV